MPGARHIILRELRRSQKAKGERCRRKDEAAEAGDVVLGHISRVVNSCPPDVADRHGYPS